MSSKQHDRICIVVASRGGRETILVGPVRIEPPFVHLTGNQGLSVIQVLYYRQERPDGGLGPAQSGLSHNPDAAIRTRCAHAGAQVPIVNVISIYPCDEDAWIPVLTEHEERNDG